MRAARVLLLVLAGLGLARPGAADVVVGNGQASSCTDAAFGAAVTTVSGTGGKITFDCGGPATITLTSQKTFLNFSNTSLVYEVDGGGLITLSGGGTTRMLWHRTGTLTLRNITFTGGRAQGAQDDASGGAVRSDGIVQPIFLNLINVTFTNNSTSLTTPPPDPPFDYGGGALFTRFGIVTLTNCRFVGNTANNTAGGALHIRSSTVNITGSLFSSNSSNGGGFGGAMHVDGVGSTINGPNGTLQVSATTFTNNTALNTGGAVFVFLYPAKNESATFDTVHVTGNQILDSSNTTYLGLRTFGGGIAVDQGNVTILNSTVANNRVHASGDGGAGGGLSLTQNGTVVIRNSTISNNRAEGINSNASGGGVLISGNASPFEVTHATIAFNFADFFGGGIQSASNGTLRNTIVSGNDAGGGFADQCASTLTNGGGVMQFPAGSPSCVSGVTVADPRLAPLGFNGGYSPTHLLNAGSPARDAGACVLATDERGVSRPQGPSCDLGAVEMTGPPPATNFFTVNPCRVLDTRLPGGPTGGAPLICGVDQVVTVTGGACGIPASAKTVATNVAVTQPSGGGSLNVFAAFSFPPQTSTVNYSAGQTRANNAVIQLSAAGQVTVRCGPGGTAHAIIDVDGYFQ